MLLLQPLQTACLQVNTDLNALTEVLAWFDQFNRPPLSYQIWLQCQLALAEGFTNAVRHAHRGKSADALIDLEVQVFCDRMEIRIWDWGAPFDLEQRLISAGEVSPSAEGGRGLKLMERISDVLNYTRVESDRNCLLMIKRFQPQFEAQTEQKS